jgi:hypothetical protein
MVVDEGLSSNKILIGGLFSSSNCPFFTLYKKAHRKMAATVILAVSKMKMTLM